MEFDRRLRRVPVLELREKLGGFFFPGEDLGTETPVHCVCSLGEC